MAHHPLHHRLLGAIPANRPGPANLPHTRHLIPWCRVAGREPTPHGRFVCDLEATIETPGRPKVLGLTKDINTSGICVLTEIPVPAGNEVYLHLRLVLDGAQSDTLTIPARTLWLTRTEGHFQVGAAFGQMPVERWLRLDVILRFLYGEIAFEPST